MRNFFTHKLWSPPGSRPHLLIPVGRDFETPLYDLFGEMISQYKDTMRTWHPEWWTILRGIGVGGKMEHVTLAYLDTPTDQTPPGSWEKLAAVMKAAAAGLPQATVTVDALVATEHGLQVRTAPSPELSALAAAARQAMLEVYGPDAPVRGGGPDWVPHIGKMYGCADDDSARPGVLAEFDPVSQPVTNIALSDWNSFADRGDLCVNFRTEIRIAVGDQYDPRYDYQSIRWA